MTFTTLTFVCFLALVFALYWSLPGRAGQNRLLVAASYVFYGWWDVRFCALMLASSLVDYLVGIGLARASQASVRRTLLCLSLASNLGLLGFFKYFDFFAESLRAAAASVGWQMDEVTLRLVLPVGISFYTFQTLSYTIDVYRGAMPATRRLVDYLAFVSFFPQLVAGPIERARSLLPQFMATRRFDRARAVDGCRQILWGFAKKLLVADRVAPFVNETWANLGDASGPQLAWATVCFAIQIYCDFSGYSDIALGTARLFGIRLMRNFAFPYFSQSVAEFWRRWHISLSTWFRDYVFIPLGGNRGTRARVGANILATFLVSGLWHGASWNFVIWGGLMGAAILPESLRGAGRRRPRLDARDTPGGEGPLPGPGASLRMVATFAVVCFGWIFFRSETLPEATLVLQRIAEQALDPEAWSGLAAALGEPRGRRTVVAIPILLAVEWLTRRRAHALSAVGAWPRALRLGLYTLLVWLLLLEGPKSSSEFIYFQF